MEDDVKCPMQMVFDPPMAAHRATEGFGIKLGRAQIIMRLALDRAGVFPFTFDHAQSGETGKFELSRVATIGEEPIDFVADGVPAGLDAAVIGVDRLAALELQPRGRGGKCRLHCGMGGRPVLLEGEDIVASAVEDRPRDLGLGPHGIDGDECAVQVQSLEQQGNGHDFIGFFRHRFLSEHETLTRGPGGYGMQGHAALGAGVAAARGLAINRDNIGHVVAQTLDPGEEAGLEHLRIDGGDDVAQGIVAGNATLIGLEAAQEAHVLLAPKVDLDEIIRPG